MLDDKDEFGTGVFANLSPSLVLYAHKSAAEAYIKGNPKPHWYIAQMLKVNAFWVDRALDELCTTRKGENNV